MIIKKFQGKTENDAVEAAKKELGSGAVVMNVREVKKKGILGVFGAKLIEVTAALEEEPDRAVPVKREAAGKEAVRETPAREVRKPENIVSEEKILEERLESLQSLLEKQFSKKEKETEEREEDKEKEEAEAKKEEENSNVRFLKLLYHTMLENEVNEKYANMIVDEMDAVLKPNMPIDYLLSNVYQKMILKFGQTGSVTEAKKGPKIVFFVGPTGVGKTTTIAKIASRFSVEEKKRVALFTTDTYRIAAAEQLRTYANILEVPFRVIYSVEELNKGIEEFKEFDFIFIDTAGHSHHNVKQREAMREYLDCVGEELEKEVYLVVSATTKYKDLISIADVYTEMTKFKLIFTKLDETVTLGNILNLRLYTGADMSYVTCGQNVPDDIEDFNPQKTVKTILGGNRAS